MSNVQIESFSDSLSESNKQQYSSKNLSDSSSTSIFSAFGIGSHVDANLKEESEFNTLALSFFRGAERKTKFSVAISKDVDGNFEAVEPHVFVSSGESRDTQKFHFNKVKAKRIRVTFLGNLDNNAFESAKLSQGFINHLGNNQNQHANILASSLQKTPAHSPPVANDHSGNKDNQFLSLSSLAVSLEELEEPDKKTLESRVKEIEEAEKKRCGCDSDSDKKQQQHSHKKNKKHCLKCKCEQNSSKGVCECCGSSLENTNYPYVIKEFPISYNFTNNNFELSKVDSEGYTEQVRETIAKDSQSMVNANEKAVTAVVSGDENGNVRKEPAIENTEKAIAEQNKEQEENNNKQQQTKKEQKKADKQKEKEKEIESKPQDKIKNQEESSNDDKDIKDFLENNDHLEIEGDEGTPDIKQLFNELDDSNIDSELTLSNSGEQKKKNK